MPLLRTTRAVASFTIVCLAACLSYAAEPWTRFQGPPDENLRAARLPLQWSASENIAWRTDLIGYGQSTPVVWEGRIFVTSISGDMKENCHVAAYNVDTGKVLWRYDTAAATQAENSSYISKAAPSPVVDALGPIALFEGGNLVALTHEGEVRWQRDLVAEYGAIGSRHGLGASLEQDAERIYVWIERDEEPYILAVSKRTGETVWKQKGLEATSWSSPRLMSVGDKEHLVLSAVGILAGLDPTSGERLWTLQDISGNSTPTPVPLEQGRFLIGATTGRDRSGGSSSAASNGVVQIVDQGDGRYEAKWLWRASRATSSFGSPIAHQGYAFFVNRAGVVYCLDLADGEEVYAKRSAGSVWATPIAVGNRIYLFGKDGVTTVISSGPKFEILAENDLWSPATETDAESSAGESGGGGVLYAAVPLDGQLLLRSGDCLYMIRK